MWLAVCLLSKKIILPLFLWNHNLSSIWHKIWAAHSHLDCSNLQTAGAHAVRMDLGHHTEFLSQVKKGKDSEAGQQKYWLLQLRSQSGKETKLMKALGILIALFLELSYQGFGAGKVATFRYHAFHNICSWVYKMTCRSVHGCNNVLGAQGHHIADTRDWGGTGNLLSPFF